MSKLEMLNSYLMERLAVAVREILEAVEATVTEYRTETAQTRIENETLKRQLREVLTTGQGKCNANNQRRLSVPRDAAEEVRLRHDNMRNSIM